MPKARSVEIIERPMRIYHGYAFPRVGRIELRTNQTPVEYLGTLIHELLHLAFPDWSEPQIDAVARFLTYHVWRQGYRRQGKSQRHRNSRKRIPKTES